MLLLDWILLFPWAVVGHSRVTKSGANIGRFNPNVPAKVLSVYFFFR